MAARSAPSSTSRTAATSGHCYLDHDDHGEMTLAEIEDLLDQFAAAGVFFLTISGGETFLRPDLFDILEHARRLMFSVKIKTNAILIKEAQARRIGALGVEGVQISIYSHKPEVHDAITLVPGHSRAPSRAPGSCEPRA